MTINHILSWRHNWMILQIMISINFFVLKVYICMVVVLWSQKTKLVKSLGLLSMTWGLLYQPKLSVTFLKQVTIKKHDICSHLHRTADVCSADYSGADQRKHQRFASLAFVRQCIKPPAMTNSLTNWLLWHFIVISSSSQPFPSSSTQNQVELSEWATGCFMHCEGNPPMTGGFPSQRASNT